MMKIGILVVCAALAGCIRSTPPAPWEAGWQTYENTRFDYRLALPQEAKGSNTPEDAWVGFGTYSNLTDKPHSDDYQIKVLAGKELPADAPCSPSFLGTSAPVVDRNDEDGVLVWGEVDERNDGTFAEPHCRVKSVYPEKNPRESMTGYGLCAEKDGRSVLICIAQVTDDPKLAEKIFSTFRWTE